MGRSEGTDYPIILFDTGKAKLTDETTEYNIEAVQFLMLVVKKFMLLPKYCEKVDVVVDLEGHGMQGTRISHFNKFVAWLNLHYAGMLNKMFIYDYTNHFSGTWKTLLNVIPEGTAKRIELVSKEEGNKKIPKAFGKDGVEEKYGGNIPTMIGSTWPSRKAGHPCTSELLAERRIERFTINGEAFDAQLFPAPYKSHPFLTLMSQNFKATVWIIVIFIFAVAGGLIFVKHS